MGKKRGRVDNFLLISGEKKEKKRGRSPHAPTKKVNELGLCPKKYLSA